MQGCLVIAHWKQTCTAHQPSVKYCRMSSRDPAAMGVAMLVPRMLSWMHVGSLPSLPRAVVVRPQIKQSIAPHQLDPVHLVDRHDQHVTGMKAPRLLLSLCSAPTGSISSQGSACLLELLEVVVPTATMSGLKRPS